jgi:TolB-like protein
MKTKIFFSVLICFSFLKVNGQEKPNEPTSATNLPTLAVANPYVNGLTFKAETVSKMIRLELIKMKKYKVYDVFDMADVLKGNAEFLNECYGQNCLVKMGKELNVDYVMCGSFDGLGNKIAITIKIVDVRNHTILKSSVKEFDNQELELQRMIEILLKEMHDIEFSKETSDRLSFKNELITSNNIGKINNSGPRIGMAYLLGSVNEFAVRPESQGGLGIFPGVSMIGYQLEKQYVGTENFSSLIECVINVSGLEQGQFIPSLTLMNGFRFGKSGWEIAFGPGFGIKQTSNGFFDNDNLFSDNQQYFSEDDWAKYAERNYSNLPEYNTTGQFVAPTPDKFNHTYNFDKKFGDMRGKYSMNTMFVFGVGRTFRAGALNIPVNVFYSSQKGGGMTGVNVGFNVQKRKKRIND